MKMSKKKIFVSALAICLIALLSMGSLAWFNATDSVENVFKFDDTDGDGTPDFKIEVFETDANGDEVKTKEYLDIMPNAKLPKDPTVRNAGDYDMYARLIVTVSDAKAWMDAAKKYDLTAANMEYTIFEKMVDLNEKWERYGNDPDFVYDANEDTLTYVYYYNEVIDEKGGEAEPLFTTVTIPHQLQAEDMGFANDMFLVDIRGDALQAENIPVADVAGSRNDAYKAFSYVSWAAGADYD